MPNAALKTVLAQLLKQQHSSSIIRFANEALTYAELIRLAQKAGSFLKEKGVTPGGRVLLGGARGLNQVVFMIGCFFIRASYVPVSAECSQEEYHRVRRTTNACCILTDDEGICDGIIYPSLFELEQRPVCKPELQADLDQEAYVLFTSGTTQQPKAVCITHRQLSTVLASAKEHIAIGRKDIVSVIHRFCFDFSVWELWYALIHGAGLYIAAHTELNNLENLLSALAQHRISLLSVTPSLFYNLGLLQTMKHYDLSHLTQIVFGGEALKKCHLEPWHARQLRYHNLYGATEATIHATYTEIIPNEFDDQMGSPIGKPLRDYDIRTYEKLIKREGFRSSLIR